MSKTDKISVNGKSYNWPTKPAVVICLDGSEPGPKDILILQLEWVQCLS